MGDWIRGTAKRECAIDAMVEVEMLRGATVVPTPVRADQVAWRDVDRWRLVGVQPTDDWIAYAHGVTPMPASALRVEIRAMRGDIESGLVTSFNWGDLGDDTIVRYRVLAGDADWIKWTGGACPVARDTRIQVKLRDGTVVSGAGADARWEHNPALSRTDIVAYRVFAAAVAEHDRLTALKDAELAKAFTAQHTAELRNAELVEQLMATDAQHEHTRNKLAITEALLDACTGNISAALSAMTAERDKLRAENEALRDLARYGVARTRNLAELECDVNEAILAGRLPMGWRE